MTIGKALHEQLRRLASDGPAGANTLASGDPTRIGAEIDRASARLDLSDSDRLSASLLGIEVALHGAADADWLERASASAPQLLGFLEEPLALIERDGEAQIAQLRSSPPAQDDAAVVYWELSLGGAEAPAARLGRYRWQPGAAEREPLPYPATFAGIARIADALEATLAA